MLHCGVRTRRTHILEIPIPSTKPATSEERDVGEGALIVSL